MKARVLALMLLAAIVVACDHDDDDDRNFPELTTTDIQLPGLDDCGIDPDHVVIIDDFMYAPPSLTVRVGETVAWVNLEECGDMPIEAVVAPLGGCDTHHQVVTFPAVPGGENVDSGPICSPNRGVAPPESAEGLSFAIDVDNCDDEDRSNVFCHTFQEPGVQHYTCFTNPGHTATLNGFITVQP